MKKITIYIVLAFTMLSCIDLDETNKNPDAAATVLPEFLSTRIILQSSQSPKSKWFLSDSWIMKTTSFTEHMEWYLYNKFERSDYDSYYILLDAQKMITIAEESAIVQEEKNAFKALNHFMRAFYFYRMTMEMGDIPCSEALKGESDGLFSPKYDTQEQVFGTIIDDLQQAYELFGKSSKLKGDPIFNGDVRLWQKTVNTFSLRVLNMLSEKATVNGKNVKDLFEQKVSLLLMENENESYARVYNSSKSAQWYPFYFENQNFYAFPVMTSSFVSLMKDLNDYRLFYYAEPAPELAGMPSNSFAAYSGVDPTIDYGKVQEEFTKGMHSPMNRRYHRSAKGEPVKFIAYSELQFILAEAALRAWKTPSTAQSHYENGVRAALKFTAANTDAEFNHNAVIDDEYIDAYLNGKAKFDQSKGLEQIMNQKHIASFLQLPFNSYFDYRRTGLPQLPINPNTNMNEVKTQLPTRWMYPLIEYSQNRENVEQAIKSQFGNVDTPNGVMWILK
ncbi:hypothetical protein AwDysgo_02550 [Bacteroidales bacterium]|nr:hypothetical protein AwDysgo_02550 [Bacteroidales bacterium]